MTTHIGYHDDKCHRQSTGHYCCSTHRAEKGEGFLSHLYLSMNINGRVISIHLCVFHAYHVVLL